MLQLLLKLFKVLNSEDSPPQIAWAVCFAALVGLSPLMSLHNVLILFLVLVLRVNLTTFVLFSFVFSGIFYILQPLLHSIGGNLLTAESLRDFWTMIYNTAVGRISNFNNTVVMGSVVFALIAWIPLYFSTLIGISYYRSHLKPWVERTQVVKMLKASNVYRLYSQLH